jgi:hypothetical protein
MKQFIITLLFTAFFGTSSFAGQKDPVNSSVLESFNKSFNNAKDVQWSASNEVYKATFLYNCQYITAFYTAGGELMGITKNILSSQLPLLLQAGLKENYSGYWISDVVEYSNQDEISYYVSLENADSKLTIRSSQNNWSVYRKVSK